MADRIDDNVGKKIVEALKMQNQEDIIIEEPMSDFEQEAEPKEESSSSEAPASAVEETETFEYTQDSQPEVEEVPYFNNTIHDVVPDQKSFINPSPSFVDNVFQQSLERNLGVVSMIGNIETPANIEILKQLITKLPAGVSKQTGALIIQQTMEALGISMKNVIAEARQVQSELSSKVRECQASIVDARKQIAMLENKAQQYQKQFSMLNDIINLFVHAAK